MSRPKALINRLGKRLLAQLRTRKITNREAAEQLGVSEWYLSRVVRSLQEKEPGKTTAQRAEAAKLAATRTKMREILAKKVLKNQITLAEAALQANCTERTIQRYMALYRK